MSRKKKFFEENRASEKNKIPATTSSSRYQRSGFVFQLRAPSASGMFPEFRLCTAGHQDARKYPAASPRIVAPILLSRKSFATWQGFFRHSWGVFFGVRKLACAFRSPSNSMRTKAAASCRTPKSTVEHSFGCGCATPLKISPQAPITARGHDFSRAGSEIQGRALAPEGIF